MPRDVLPLPDAPVADATLDHAMDVLALEASIAWAFGDDLDALTRSTMPTDADGLAAIERALGRERLVDAGSCATWTSLTGTLVLDGCALGVGSLPVDGTVRVELMLTPVRLRISFDAVVVRGSTLSGAFVLSGDPRSSVVERIFEADMSFLDEGRVTSMRTIGTVAVWDHEASLGMWFQGTWSADGITDGIGGQIGWRPTQCLPWTGTMRFDSVPFAEGLYLTFLETTRDDGGVFGAGNHFACR